MSPSKILTLLLAAVLLAACGGGGGDDPDRRLPRVFPPETVGEAASFTHRATLGNTVDHRTFLEHDYCNGDPDAILIVTQLYVPGVMGFGVYNVHDIAVQYDAARARWAILNTDVTDIPIGARFNVTAATGNIVGDTRFASYVTTPENSSEHLLVLDHPLLNGRPGTPIFVTQNVSALGQSLRRCPYVPSVTYSPGLGRWTVTNYPSAGPTRLEFDTGYNICIPESGDGNHFSEVILQSATDIDGPSARLNLFGTQTAIVHVTPVYNTGTDAPTAGYGYPHAVWYETTHGWWNVMNEVAEPMRPNTRFFAGSARP